MHSSGIIVSELRRLRGAAIHATHARRQPESPAMLVMRQVRAQEKAFQQKAQRTPPPPPAPPPAMLPKQPPPGGAAAAPQIKILVDNTTRPVEVVSVAEAQRRINLKHRVLNALRPAAIVDEHQDEQHDEHHDDEERDRMRIDLMGNKKLLPAISERPLEVMMMERRRRRGVAYRMHHVADDGGGGGGGGGGRGGGGRRTHWVRMRYALGVLGAALSGVGAYLLVTLGWPHLEPLADGDGGDASQHALWRHLRRFKDQLVNCNKLIREPSREKLLPDVLRPPYYQPPYTLVMEFTDLLVHPEWTYQTGWRFKKRPGVDEFLDVLYTRFEVVVYTAQVGMTVFPVLDALDERNLISYKLVRDATNFIDGHHVKDLDKLNRDLSKVVVVDWNPDSLKLHMRNLFHIPRWDGSDQDRTLYDLAAFLIAISEWEVADVRTVLEYYAQFDNPLAKFKENQLQALKATQ